MKHGLKRLSVFLAVSSLCVIIFLLTSCLESDIPQYESALLSDASTAGDFESSITVSGEGTVKAVADLVLANISVVTEKPTSEEAVEENSTISNAVIDAIERIDAEYIRVQTAGYSLNPLYYYQDESSPPEIYAYRVTSSINVETTDIEKIGQIITLAIENGANDISSLRFDLSVSAKEQAKKEALRKASLDAASKAGAIADSLGLELANIIMINESGTSYPGPVYSLQKIESVISEDRELVPPVVEPQEIEVSSSVDITYSFR